MGSAQAAGVSAALVVAGCFAGTGIAQAAPTPSPAPTPPPASAAPPAPKTVIDSDGSYAVGTDIVPGVYRSAGPVEGSVCYWKRVSGGKIIDNALTKIPQVVQIEPTDTLFKTDRCQPWQMTTCPPDCADTQQPPPGPPGVLKGFLPQPQQPQQPQQAPQPPPPPQAPAPGGG